VEADPGVMGGNKSDEFMAPAESGEDLVFSCPKCKFTKAADAVREEACPKCNHKLDTINTIEIGHIFKLGTKYTSTLGVNYLDATGKLKPIIMGCYGIGVSRLVAAIIEQNHDAEGIILPNEISPYDVIIIALDVTDKKIMDKAQDIYQTLTQNGIAVLFDDRDERAGVKFKDADLIGLPLQIIIGKNFLENGKVEFKMRKNKSSSMLEADALVKAIKNELPDKK
jgi:prolyl-tRNA synthetase